MHLEKLLLIGSTECGLTKFRSSWIGPNNFPFKEVAYPQNSIFDPNVGVISNEQLSEIKPTYNYDADLASNDVQPIAEVYPWSIHGPMVGQPVGVGKPVEQWPKIEPTHNYDDVIANEDVPVEVNPWTINGPKVGQPVMPPRDVDMFIKPLSVEPMIVHDVGSPRSTPPPVFACEHNEYEISIAMGSDLWSGTDDEVEIRLYFLDGSVSEWFDLRIPMYNAFERLSIDSFCVRPQSGTLQKPSFIGLRKFGRDQMKIESVMVSSMMSSSAFNVGQWIRTNDEFLF